MSHARLVYEKTGDRALVRFDNPTAHNALTSRMWHDLRDAARDIAADPTIRVATFRGVGGKAFISGTDISKFADYETGEQGVDYERDIDICMGAIDEIPCTTIAIVDGWAVGGGLNISSACDFRIATPNARFGSPIGRTIGNCLSAMSVARIGGAIGLQMAKRMVLLGELVPACRSARTGSSGRCALPPRGRECAADDARHQGNAAADALRQSTRRRGPDRDGLWQRRLQARRRQLPVRQQDAAGLDGRIRPIIGRPAWSRRF